MLAHPVALAKHGIMFEDIGSQRDLGGHKEVEQRISRICTVCIQLLDEASRGEHCLISTLYTSFLITDRFHSLNGLLHCGSNSCIHPLAAFVESFIFLPRIEHSDAVEIRNHPEPNHPGCAHL